MTGIISVNTQPQTTPHPHGVSTLRHNFSWTLVGSVMYAACQWAMLVALAKVGSARMVGEFALALAVTTPVILMTNLNLRVVQATDVQNDYSFRDYFVVRSVMLVIAVTAIALLCLTFGYDGHMMLVVAMVSIAKIFDSISDIIYGLLQLHENMRRIAISRITQGVLQLLVLTVVVRQSGSIVWAAAAMAAGSALITLLYDVPGVAPFQWHSTKHRHGKHNVPHPYRLWTLVRVALPLGIVAGFHTLNANVPRFFIDRTMGPQAVGIFTAMWYLVPTGGLVLGAMVQAASPRLARYFVDDIAAYKRLVWSLVALAVANGAAGIVAAVAFGRFLLTVLYRPEYAAYPSAFVWIMVGAALAHVAWTLAGAASAARYFSMQLPIYVAASAVTAVASAWLVPTHQFVGAAWALCLGGSVCVAGFGTITAYAVHTRSVARNAVPTQHLSSPTLRPMWT